MQKLKMWGANFKRNKLLYVITAYTFFACIAHINSLLEIVLMGLVISAPLFLDDTDTLSMYIYSACFMNCYSITSFLWVVSISAFLLELKKIYIAIRYKKDFKEASKVIIVWLVLAIALTIYSFIYNNFHFHRMSVFIDFIQCFLVFYLVKDSINLNKIVLTWSYGIILSVVIAILFHYAHIDSQFIEGMVGNRFGAFLCNINSLSVYCTICAICLISLLMNKSLSNKFAFLPILVTILGLVTYSKAFFVVNLLIYFFWFVYSLVKAKDKQDFIANSLFVLALLIIICALTHQYFIDMVNRFIGERSNGWLDSITTGRVTIWYEYIKQWLDNPVSILFGNGYASPKIASNKYEHCLYIAFLNRFGIIGSIAVISIMIWTAIKDGMSNRKVGNFLPLIAILIYGLVDNVSGVLFTCLPLCVCLFILTHKQQDKINKK